MDKSNLMRAMLKIRDDLKERKFDVLLNMHASMSANLISTMIPSKRKVGFDKARSRDKQSLFCNEYIPARTEQHVADGMIEFINHISKESDHPIWESIDLSPEENEAKEYIDGDKITCVISPCTVSYTHLTLPTKA